MERTYVPQEGMSWEKHASLLSPHPLTYFSLKEEENGSIINETKRRACLSTSSFPFFRSAWLKDGSYQLLFHCSEKFWVQLFSLAHYSIYSIENLAHSRCSINISWTNKWIKTPVCGGEWTWVSASINLEEKFSLEYVVLRCKLGGKILGSLIMAIYLRHILRSNFVRYKEGTCSSAWLLCLLFFQFSSKLVEERTVIYFYSHIPTFINCLKLIILLELIRFKFVRMIKKNFHDFTQFFCRRNGGARVGNWETQSKISKWTEAYEEDSQEIESRIGICFNKTYTIKICWSKTIT